MKHMYKKCLAILIAIFMVSLSNVSVEAHDDIEITSIYRETIKYSDYVFVNVDITSDGIIDIQCYETMDVGFHGRPVITFDSRYFDIIEKTVYDGNYCSFVETFSNIYDTTILFNLSSSKSIYVGKTLHHIRIKLKDEYMDYKHIITFPFGSGDIELDFTEHSKTINDYITELESENNQLGFDNDRLEYEVKSLKSQLDSILIGDLNNDKSIDILDAVVIRRFLAGTIDELPYIPNKGGE